jgi:hypothetical protein
LTSWVRTSSLDAPRAGTFRQEALLGVPRDPAAQSRMLRTVRSRDLGAQHHPRASIRLGGGAAAGNCRSEPKDETLVDTSLPQPLNTEGASARPGPPSQRRPGGLPQPRPVTGAPRSGARVPARASEIGTQVRASPADGAGGSRAHRAPQPDATDRSPGANGAAEAPDRAGANLADPDSLSPADEMVPRFLSPGSR